jgi:exopolyphosphatase/guanosine-5'-triphosphate,3'-diphosphate pyrophosphatase
VTIKAAIDVGTNSVKLLVLELRGGQAYSVLAEDARVTGLGKGVAKTAALAPDAMRATLDCLRDFVERARALGAESIRVAGTEALRLAGNREAFVAQARAELGVDVEVLSPDDEARLSRAVALRELPAGAGDVVFFDVGGGSTELTWCSGEELSEARSLPLGARRCTEQAGIGQPVAQQAHHKLVQMILSELERAAPGPWREETGGAAGCLPRWPARLAGLGGTASQLVWLLQGVRGEVMHGVNGAQVQKLELAELAGRLAGLALPALQALPHMDPARAEIIYAGLVIVFELLEFYGASELTVIDRGLRYGLLLG